MVYTICMNSTGIKVCNVGDCSYIGSYIGWNSAKRLAAFGGGSKRFLSNGWAIVTSAYLDFACGAPETVSIMQPGRWPCTHIHTCMHTCVCLKQTTTPSGWHLSDSISSTPLPGLGPDLMPAPPLDETASLAGPSPIPSTYTATGPIKPTAPAVVSSAVAGVYRMTITTADACTPPPPFPPPPPRPPPRPPGPPAICRSLGGCSYRPYTYHLQC